jgi:hypothetical protein
LPALEAAARRPFRAEDLDTIVVHNTGAIPPVRIPGDDSSGQPGFNVIVAERGRVSYFCKCRPAGDAALTHEGAIGDILTREPSTTAHVAATHLRRGDVMDVLVVRRLPGRPYYELLVKEGDARWMSSVATVLGLVEQMASCVGNALPALRGPAALRLADEGRWALSVLVDQGLSPGRADTLGAALARAGEVPARLQHGDLWPPNVLVDGASWYVLDFEQFGRIRVPLYDLLHMLHMCSEVRRPAAASEQPWAERLVTGDPAEARPVALTWRVAQRDRLPPASAFGALVYYVVDMAARVRARGAWSADWREYLAQAARLADLVADGVATPERLFTSGRV